MPSLISLHNSVRVNDSTANGHYSQSATFRVSQSDDILVTWFSGGIRFDPGPQRSRIVDENGGYVTAEFPGGSPPPGVNLNDYSAVQGNGRATLVDGGYVTAYHSQGRDGSSYGIVAQVFNADGSARSGEFIANYITQGEQAYPWVMSVDQDLFMITWVQGGGGSGSGRLFHSSGRSIGGEFSVSGNIGSGSYGAPVHLLDEYRFVTMRLASSDLTLNYYDINRAAIQLGTAANETFQGGGVVDSVLVGFAGDDIYLVDSAGDEVQEWAGEGYDWVLAAGDHKLLSGQHIERLSTSLHAGTAAINLTGNEFSQLIHGNAGANILDGAGGADTLVGLGGDDMYLVRDALDLVIETADGGFDHVLASVSYVLAADQEVERLSTSLHAGTASINLTGNALSQLIHGNAGKNVLDGGGGADVLIGLGGDDIYLVRDARDIVIEAAGEGYDYVLASVSYALTAGQHVERLSTTLHAGTDSINLTGNALAQLIHGNAGANMIDSGGGGDLLLGLGGDDMYFVRDSKDAVFEDAGGGFDHVLASISYALGAGQSIERMSTDFHAGTAAINLTGNALSQLIHGNAGSNVLDGGGGGDVLIGLGGDDSYFVRTAGDAVVEGANGGTDRIYAGLDYQLGEGSEVEIMSTDWNSGTDSIDLRGNLLQQAIYGNEGNNILSGGGGKDVLVGGGGADSFLFDQVPNAAFTANWDALGATANVARIADFDVSDRILLKGSVFGMIPGAVPASAFAYGSVATEASHRFLYDRTTQALLFDPDGLNGEAARLVAYIDNPFNLDASFLFII